METPTRPITITTPKAPIKAEPLQPFADRPHGNARRRLVFGDGDAASSPPRWTRPLPPTTLAPIIEASGY
jgi:hypothetical protein